MCHVMKASFSTYMTCWQMTYSYYTKTLYFLCLVIRYSKKKYSLLINLRIASCCSVVNRYIQSNPMSGWNWMYSYIKGYFRQIFIIFLWSAKLAFEYCKFLLSKKKMKEWQWGKREFAIITNLRHYRLTNMKECNNGILKRDEIALNTILVWYINLRTF